MFRIVDSKGKPINSTATELQSEQNSQTALLERQFANHPTRGLTPQRLAQIFQNAEQGYLVDQCDLFEDIEEKDVHIVAELGKRKRALLGLEWVIKAPKNPTAAELTLVEFFTEFFTELLDFDDLILNLSEAIGYGFACCEIQWGFDSVANKWLPTELFHRPARWFQLPMTNRNQIRLRDGSSDGLALEPAGWLVHTHHAKSGDLSRAGLLRSLAWTYLYKNYSVRDLAEFLEIYGLPLRLGTYQSGASDNEKATLMRAVVNIGHAAAGIIPEGMAITFTEAAKGSADPHLAMIDWCERTQSKVILGGTLTSDTGSGGGGSYALGNVHNEVRRDLMMSDAKQIQGTLTHGLMKLIATVNGLLVDGSRLPCFEFDLFEPVDMALYADALPKLVGVGVPVPVSYALDKLRIPAAKDNEALLGSSIASAIGETKTVKAIGLPQAALSGKFNNAPVFTADQQIIETLVDNALANLSSPINDTAIHNAIKAAASYEDLADRLAVLLGESDTQVFRDLLAKATFAADVMGFANVE